METMTTMLSYHGDAAVKAGLLDRIAAHEAADAIVQGVYWEADNGGYRGCAVGCSLHQPGESLIAADLEALYPERLGLPRWLAHLEDHIFEGLPLELARRWPRRFAEAIPVGVEIGQAVADELAVRRLREECLPLATSWPAAVRDKVVSAVEKVIAALEDPSPESAQSARSAAESAAGSASQSAAGSASQSAWQSAWSAAESAWSAWSAAESAAGLAAESAAGLAQSAWSAAQSAAGSAQSEWPAARSARLAVWAHEADRVVEVLSSLRPDQEGSTDD